MYARLIREAEKREKEKSTRDERPTVYLDVGSYFRVILPNEACDLPDPGIMAVHVGPAYPRSDTQLCIVHNDIHPQRNSPEYLDAADGHQAEVPATTQTRGQH